MRTGDSGKIATSLPGGTASGRITSSSLDAIGEAGAAYASAGTGATGATGDAERVVEFSPDGASSVENSEAPEFRGRSCRAVEHPAKNKITARIVNIFIILILIKKVVAARNEPPHNSHLIMKNFTEIYSVKISADSSL